MLQLRPSCECCDRDLDPAQRHAFICSFECTFCRDCAERRLGGACPNCGGELVRRPVRPADKRAKFPPSTERVFKPQGCRDVLATERPTRAASPLTSALRVSIEPHAPESLRQHVRDHLDTFNVAATGFAEYHSVSIFLRDEHDEVLGGLLGAIWGGWLHVAFLWVAEPLRGRGHGRWLLEAAERYAVERGCSRAWLTTFSFQAPGFYPRLGYETFGVLDDHPLGHRHLFFQKSLPPRTNTPRH